MKTPHIKRQLNQNRPAKEKTGFGEEKLKEGLNEEEQKELKALLSFIEEGVPPSTADQYIKDLISEYNIHPIVSVPKKYEQKLEEEGVIKPQTTWMKSQSPKLIVGTIGRKPYRDKDGRALFKVTKPNEANIKPRFTGEDNNFHGVVEIQEPFLKIGEEVKKIK